MGKIAPATGGVNDSGNDEFLAAIRVRNEAPSDVERSPMVFRNLRKIPGDPSVAKMDHLFNLIEVGILSHFG